MKLIEVKIKIINERAMVPEFKTKGAACADVYSVHDVVVPAGSTVIVPLGFAMELPVGAQAKLLGRSGLSKKGIKVDTGTIDSDYRGEVGVSVYNSTNLPYRINVGDRIGQLDVIEAPKTAYVVVKELTPTSRGTGGFGHTGV